MTADSRITLAKQSLVGISIGDAFGESFFGDTTNTLAAIRARRVPTGSWEFTDDTVMAIAVYKQLQRNGNIDPLELAKAFADNHRRDPNRGYGATVRRILRAIAAGEDWQRLARDVFSGMGSMGNGAAMRVGPIGAYHFDDIARVKELATESAEVTHTNIEGVAGAIAVAMSTALATRVKQRQQSIKPNEFIEQVAEALPATDTRSKIRKALHVPYSYRIDTVRTILGNGSQMLAQDTVPFAVWCAAHHLTSFEEALWKAVSILGDRDTICAIVGGITVMSSDEDQIPKEWQNAAEKVEESEFMK